MMYVINRTWILLVVALYSIKPLRSYLLRKSTTEEAETKDEDTDTTFEISNYIYKKTRKYSKRRIHTYCNSKEDNCGGLPFFENMMIMQWVTFWEREGWDPVVLTIEQARLHVDFAKYDSFFVEQKFSANQEHMFFRYLAMSSTAGAEWFSESHTLPLRPLLNGDDGSLPNNGKFTVYDRHVPSLMSGNEQEWERISQKLLKDPQATDLEGLSRLLSFESDAFATEQSVMHANYVIGDEQFDIDICRMTRDKRAVRLSINEFQGGNRPSIYKWSDVVESYMKVWNAKCRSGRPVIFTYFEPIKSVSTSRSMDLLEAWKKAWSHAGWEPVVLELKDMMRHPKHREIINIFEHSPGKYSMSIYDRMCFYRWFAMAASGGGWMADIDAFPLYMDPVKLGTQLPYNGLLTGFARHIPCLVSGSAQEWNRLGFILVDSYKIHADEFWSDMLALAEVHDILDVFQYKREVVEFHHLFDKDVKLQDPYQMRTGNRDRCLLANDKKAVHFSHYSVRQGIEDVGFSDEDFDNQEKIAVKWTNSWKEQCMVAKDNIENEVDTMPANIPQTDTNIQSFQEVQSRPVVPQTVSESQSMQEVKKEVDPYGDKGDSFKIEW